MSASKKRKAASLGASNKKNTEKALQNLNRLSDEEKHAALEELIRSPLKDATSVVLKKVKALDKKPLTEPLLKSFGSRTHAAIHQLDRLRCSQQFEQVDRVWDDLSELVNDAKRYAPVATVSLLSRIAGVFSHSVENTGEVFKGLTSPGGFHCELPDAMKDALKSIGNVEGEVKGQLENAKSQLERVHSRLTGYCIDEFKEVIDAIDEKLSDGPPNSVFVIEDDESDNQDYE